jgi:hypothetical protein
VQPAHESPAARFRPLFHAATVELGELAEALGPTGLVLVSVSLSLSRVLTRATRISDPVSSLALLSSGARSARETLARCFEGRDADTVKMDPALDRLRELVEVLRSLEDLSAPDGLPS